MRIEEEIQQAKFKNARQKAMINLIYTSNWLQSRHQDLLKPFGITSQQFNILRILKGQHPKAISGAEIKSRMLDRNSDVSRLLDRLIAKNFITRQTCPNDKRATDVSINDAGLALLTTLDKEFTKKDLLLIKISEQEAEQLSNLLDKIRD